jgi:hypothetical protein
MINKLKINIFRVRTPFNPERNLLAQSLIYLKPLQLDNYYH